MERVLQKDWISGDEYLTPVVEDDPLLYSFEDDPEDEEFTNVQLTTNVGNIEELKVTKQELKSLKEQFEGYKQMVQKTFMSDTVEKELKKESSSKSIYRDNGNYYYDSYASRYVYSSSSSSYSPYY